jgi:hypothetical protein
MTRDERMRFIDDELKGLWPQWEPTEAEIRVWMGTLSRPAYELARRAAQQCFCERAGNFRRPMPGPFLEKLKLLTPRAASQAVRDIQTDTFVECLDPPAGKPHLAGVRRPVYVQPLSRQSEPDYVHACAESMRRRFEQLYGGHWITVRTEPAPAVDDGLRGEAARQKAYANILAGPDTPGKRWLQSHLPRHGAAGKAARVPDSEMTGVMS